jgi:preprotein translocase subunit SecA
MNSQREVVYKRRRNALYGDRLAVDIENMFMETCEGLVDEYQSVRDYEGFRLEVLRIFSAQTAITQDKFLKDKAPELVDILFHEVTSLYKRKNEHISQMAYPVIKKVYDEQGHQYENILIPVTDGSKNIQLLVNLKKAVDSTGREVVRTMERMITLAMIDEAWKEHLRDMDELKQSVQHAVYEQKDPLLIYKLESFNLFKAMIGKVSKEISSFLMKGSLPAGQGENQVPAARAAAAPAPPRPAPNLRMSRTDAPPPQEPQKASPVVNTLPKTGRNDLCPCGSGKKYKNCHMPIEAAQS